MNLNKRVIFRRLAVPLLSALIFGILLLQSTVSFVLFPTVHHLSHTWPFLDYPMYSAPHFEGDRISRNALLASREDWSEVEVAPEDVGLGYWHFQQFIGRLQKGEQRAARELAQLYERKQTSRLLALRLESHDLIFGRDYVSPAEPQVLAEFHLEKGKR